MSIDRTHRTFQIARNVINNLNVEDDYYIVIIRTASWNGQQPFVEIPYERFATREEACAWIDARRF